MGIGKGNENVPWIYRGIDFQTLGKQIKKYRVLRGLRQSDLAELIFSTTNTISRIEIGGIGCSLENLLRIADALQVSPDALLFGNFNPMYSRFYPYFWDMKENLSEIFKEISSKEQLTFVERDFQKWLKMTKQSREEMEAQAKEQSGEELRYSVEDYLFSATKVADPEEKVVEENPEEEKKTKAQLRKEEKARQRESARKEKQLTQEEQRQRVRKEAGQKKK